MTSPESRLKEIREKIVDYWFVDNPNGSDVNDEIVWLCDQLDLANKRCEILREAILEVQDLADIKKDFQTHDMPGFQKQRNWRLVASALKAADEVK